MKICIKLDISRISEQTELLNLPISLSIFQLRDIHDIGDKLRVPMLTETIWTILSRFYCGAGVRHVIITESDTQLLMTIQSDAVPRDDLGVSIAHTVHMNFTVYPKEKDIPIPVNFSHCVSLWNAGLYSRQITNHFTSLLPDNSLFAEQLAAEMYKNHLVWHYGYVFTGVDSFMVGGVDSRIELFNMKKGNPTPNEWIVPYGYMTPHTVKARASYKFSHTDTTESYHQSLMQCITSLLCHVTGEIDVSRITDEIQKHCGYAPFDLRLALTEHGIHVTKGEPCRLKSDDTAKPFVVPYGPDAFYGPDNFDHVEFIYTGDRSGYREALAECVSDLLANVNGHCDDDRIVREILSKNDLQQIDMKLALGKDGLWVTPGDPSEMQSAAPEPVTIPPVDDDVNLEMIFMSFSFRDGLIYLSGLAKHSPIAQDLIRKYLKID